MAGDRGASGEKRRAALTPARVAVDQLRLAHLGELQVGFLNRTRHEGNHDPTAFWKPLNPKISRDS